MPNWVYNTIEVTGKPAKVAEFLAQASKPIPVQKYDVSGKFPETLDGEWEYRETEFSFWNFVQPPEDKWGEYFSKSGIVANVKYGETPYNWYNWNTRNWGTKWDACEVEVSDEPGRIVISFDSAWSPPLEVLSQMIEEDYRDLNFVVNYREEQGWGGKITAEANGEINHEEWDIPDGHDEWVEIYGSCEECEWGGCLNEEVVDG